MDEKFISPEIEALPEIKVIISPSSLGYAKAKNLGLNQAKSRFIMSTDSDIPPVSNWLEICLTEAAKPETSMMGGPVIHRCGSHLFGKDIWLQTLRNWGIMKLCSLFWKKPSPGKQKSEHFKSACFCL